MSALDAHGRVDSDADNSDEDTFAAPEKETPGWLLKQQSQHSDRVRPYTPAELHRVQQLADRLRDLPDQGRFLTPTERFHALQKVARLQAAKRAAPTKVSATSVLTQSLLT